MDKTAETQVSEKYFSITERKTDRERDCILAVFGVKWRRFAFAEGRSKNNKKECLIWQKDMILVL